MSLFGTQPLFGTSQPSGLTASGITTQPSLNLPNSGGVFGGLSFGTQNSGLFQPATSKPSGSLFPTFSTNVTQQTSSVFPSFSTATQPGGLFAPQTSLGLGSTFKPSLPTTSSLFQPQGGNYLGHSVLFERICTCYRLSFFKFSCFLLTVLVASCT